MITKELIRKKGITLVALVITVIVLLILAGVALNLVVGEEGIAKRAIDSKDQHEIAQEKEKISIALYQANMESVNEKLSKSVLQKAVNENLGEGEIEVYENDKFFSLINKNGLIYIVEKNGEMKNEISKRAINYKIYGNNTNLPSEYQEVYFIEKKERTGKLDRSQY